MWYRKIRRVPVLNGPTIFKNLRIKPAPVVEDDAM